MSFHTQVKSVDFEKYLYLTDQGPAAKKLRRESSSLVDEFFQDDLKDSPELNNAKHIVNQGFLGRKRYLDLNNLRTGLCPPRSGDVFRREVSPLAEEVREDGLQRLGLIKSPAKTTKIDLSETMLDPASMVTGGFVDLREQSKHVDDSIWEDVKDSIDMVNSEENTNSAKDPIVIKEEEDDISYKPACQFQNSRIPSFENISVKLEPSPSSCLLAGSNTDDNVRPKSLSLPQQQMMFSQPPSSVTQYMAQLNSIAMNKSMTSSTFSTPTPPHMVPVFLPPTPPNSEPNSPSQDAPMRRTPPPPYPGVQRHQSFSTLNIQPIPYTPAPPRTTSKMQMTHPGCSTIKYNRKNNPDLEKRRIHFCDFPGKYFLLLVEVLDQTALNTEKNIKGKIFNNVYELVIFVTSH